MVEERMARLEVHTDDQDRRLELLEKQLDRLLAGIQLLRGDIHDIQKDVHAAKFAGRVVIGAAIAVGSLIGTILTNVFRS